MNAYPLGDDLHFELLTEGQRLANTKKRLRALASPNIKNWQNVYTAGTMQLSDSWAQAGAEAVFDMALTNGLLAIAAAENPRLLDGRGNRLPPASVLLVGLAAVNEVDAAGLSNGIQRVNAVRHGRTAPGVVTEADVELLRQLDNHPALGHLHDVELDQYWARGTVADQFEARRAADYLALFEQGEIDRRVDDIARRFEFLKYQAKGDQVGQECDVCEYETMNVEGAADFPGEPVEGTCLLCSYRRSSVVASAQGIAIMMDHHMGVDM